MQECCGLVISDQGIKQLRKLSICLAGSAVMGLRLCSKLAADHQPRMPAHPYTHTACTNTCGKQLMGAKSSFLMCRSLSTCHSKYRSFNMGCSNTMHGLMPPQPLLTCPSKQVRRPASTLHKRRLLIGRHPWQQFATASAALQPQDLDVLWSRRLYSFHR